MNNVELSEFYKVNVGKIYKFFYYKSQSRNIAEDLTSQVFVEFVKKLKQEKSVDNYGYYINGISKLIWINHLKTKYKDNSVNMSELSEDSEEFITNTVENFESRIDLSEKIKKYIDQLPAAQKTVAQLRFEQKLSLDEICKHLNKEMPYVKTTQQRAIASLKKLIEIEYTNIL